MTSVCFVSLSHQPGKKKINKAAKGKTYMMMIRIWARWRAMDLSKAEFRCGHGEKELATILYCVQKSSAAGGEKEPWQKSRKIRGNSYFYAKFSVQFKASDQGKQTNRQIKEESLSSMKSKFSNRCYLYLYTYKFYWGKNSSSSRRWRWWGWTSHSSSTKESRGIGNTRDADRWYYSSRSWLWYARHASKRRRSSFLLKKQQGKKSSSPSRNHRTTDPAIRRKE